MISHEILQLLRHQRSAWPESVADGVPDVEIEDAERAFGVQLPEDYKSFVREFGGAVLGNENVLGLRRPEYMRGLSGTFPEATLRFRKKLPAEFKEMLVISVDGSGNPVGFLPGNPTVFIFDHDFGGRIDLAPSFSSYVEQIVSGNS